MFAAVEYAGPGMFTRLNPPAVVMPVEPLIVMVDEGSVKAFRTAPAADATVCVVVNDAVPADMVKAVPAVIVVLAARAPVMFFVPSAGTSGSATAIALAVTVIVPSAATTSMTPAAAVSQAPADTESIELPDAGITGPPPIIMDDLLAGVLVEVKSPGARAGADDRDVSV